MAARSHPTARQVRLGAELRKLREAAGLKAREVAAFLNSTSTQMSQVEAGIAAVSAERIRRLAAHYACTDQDVTLTGPLTIAASGSGQVRIWVTNGAVGATGSINAAGDATDLQVFQTPDTGGATTAASVCGATVVGLLYLPASSIACAASPLSITGAVVAGSWNGLVSGLHYDATAASVRRSTGYALADWHECAPPVGDLGPTAAAWRTSDC